MFKDNTTQKNIELSIRKILIFLIFSFILVSSLVLLSKPANAYERPVFRDGLTDKWHPGAYCIPCHYTLLDTEQARAISNGCKCHYVGPGIPENKYKIDMAPIFDIHKDIVCIKCHVGNKDGNNVTEADFHRVMNKVACLSCHTFENGTYQKPQKTKCSDCHGGDPHVVHGDRLQKMCVACHGEFVLDYTGKPGLPSAPNQSLIFTREYTTIGEIMTRIIDSLMRLFR